MPRRAKRILIDPFFLLLSFLAVAGMGYTVVLVQKFLSQVPPSPPISMDQDAPEE